MIKILLVEDNVRDVESIKRALLNSGEGAYLDSYDFVVAIDLNQGLKILKQGEVDVVLLDLGLPDNRDFDGIDRIKKITPLVPIIVLTRQREETLIALEAVKRGAQDYFSKSHLSEVFSLDRVIRYSIERKKNEEELIRAREEALKGSKAKSEFLSNVSHDIRTPLNCIIGVADLLLGSNLSEENSNYVQMLNKASDTLLSLINNVLDLSIIESGQIKIEKEPFDLLDTVESALDIFVHRAHSKGIELIFRIDPNVPRKFIGDPDRLNQILVNLIGNAIKFTKEGEVTLNVCNVGESPPMPVIRFTVKDTGVGIPAEKQSVIFESFTQLEQDETSLKRQGSGLGLSICKKLIVLMNGNITVESETGKGSTFQFDLPLNLPQKLPSQTVIPPLNLEKIEILIVDDNAAHRLVLLEFLRYWGAIVQEAENMQEAILITEKCKATGRKIDIAFLDLRMPGIATGGMELAGKLSSRVNFMIAMLPTNHRHGDIESIKEAGFGGYFFKPARPELLAEIIAGVLPKGSKTPSLSKNSVDDQSMKQRSILVADDSEENRLLIKAYCKDTHFVLEMAEDGREAFEKFQKQNFDLVLMDIQMPRLNGYETLKAIQEWEKSRNRPHVPVLALTAFALKEESEKCLSAGFKAHVTKPIKKNDLIQTMRKYFA